MNVFSKTMPARLLNLNWRCWEKTPFTPGFEKVKLSGGHVDGGSNTRWTPEDRSRDNMKAQRWKYGERGSQTFGRKFSSPTTGYQ